MNQSVLYSLVQHNCNSSEIALIQNYPEISLNCDGINHSSASPSSFEVDSSSSVIVPVNEGALKRIVRTYYEHGFDQALNEARSPLTADKWPIIANIANSLYKLYQSIVLVQVKILPHKPFTDLKNFAAYSETRDWERSYVRYIAWHPHCFKIAVVGLDDFIRIYTDEPILMPLLKFVRQRAITSLAWRPSSGTELAVGCKNGIVLWNAARTATQPELFKHPQNKGVISLEWNSDGSLLASTSIGDPNIIIWNVDTHQLLYLTRSGPPCSLIKWSPKGAYLFSATLNKIFRVWDATNKWKPERWSTSEGFIQSACWSPCTKFLLFVNSHDNLLYYLQFGNKHFATIENSSEAIAAIDLSKVWINKYEIGGKPQQLAWDSMGMFLAVSFKDSSNIALFSTSIQRDEILISPCAFVPGRGAEYPGFICFERRPSNKNVVLTIGWSSGRVQFVPCH